MNPARTNHYNYTSNIKIKRTLFVICLHFMSSVLLLCLFRKVQFVACWKVEAADGNNQWELANCLSLVILTALDAEDLEPILRKYDCGMIIPMFLSVCYVRQKQSSGCLVTL